MFNVTIIRLKDVIKYLIFAIIIIFITYIINKIYVSNFKETLNKLNIKEYFSDITYKLINIELPIASNLNSEIHNEGLIDENNEDADKDFIDNLYYSMIELEIGAINIDTQINNQENLEVSTNKETQEDTEQNDEKTAEESNEKTNEEGLELALEGVTTEVITENPITESYTQIYNDIKIKNETDFELTDDVLNSSNLEIDTSNIIIFHTHTCESYTSSDEYSYTPTGNFRTTDLNYSVARVGDKLTEYLTQYKYNVIHDKTYHDYPAYNGSYNRSLETVSNILETTQADIIIDLHRDAIGSYSTYAPTVKIGEDECAQLMFVIGTNGGGLNHPNWHSNLQFAVKVQEIANQLYPGLFKPIIVRNSRYNQHLGKAACIIEVGATGNTMEQCLNSMKYLSKVISEGFF